MKRKIFVLATAITLAGSITFTSCIGQFALSNKVLDWNKGVGGKFINEVLFLAMWIVPVYEICMFADVIVFNSIEFWSGNNPVAEQKIQTIEGQNGNYTVETKEDGYKITNENGQELGLIYDEEENTWSYVVGDEATKLVKIEGDKAVVYTPNGEKNVELNAEGVLAFRQEVQQSLYFAAK